MAKATFVPASFTIGEKAPKRFTVGSVAVRPDIIINVLRSEEEQRKATRALGLEIKRSR
jgi:hypothetical protein